MQTISREDVVRARSARCLWNLGAKAALALSYSDPPFSSSFRFKRNGRLKVKMTKVTNHIGATPFLLLSIIGGRSTFSGLRFSVSGLQVLGLVWG